MFLVNVDPRTVGAVTDLVALSTTLLALLLWRTGKMYPGFGRWTLGRFVGSLTIVFSFQIAFWPAAIVFAGASTLLAAALAMDSCRQFLGNVPQRVSPRYPWTRLPRVCVPWVYLGTALLVLQVMAIQPFAWSTQWTYMEVTFALAVLHMWTGAILFRGRPVISTSRGRVLAGAAFSLRGVIYLLRTFYFLMHPQGTLFDDSALNKSFLLSNIVYEIVVNFAFFLMNYERVVQDKAREVNQTVAANHGSCE